MTKEGTILVSSTSGHHEKIEIDRAGNIIWVFRNYHMPALVFKQLTNGFFKEMDEEGNPKHWVLATRLSEGGGRLIWVYDNKPRPCPGLEYDRPGALCLQQTIAVKPGSMYKVAGEIKTIEVKGSASLQMEFVDAYGGSIYDVTEVPSGQLFTGTNDWSLDVFEVKAPGRATAVELRLFINDRGKVFVRNLMFHPL